METIGKERLVLFILGISIVTIPCKKINKVVEETDKTSLLKQSSSNALRCRIVDYYQSVSDNYQHKIETPEKGNACYRQDAAYDGNQLSYTDNGDINIIDSINGLMFQKSPSWVNDGDTDARDKKAYTQAITDVAKFNLAEYTGWRLPNAKELQSILDYTHLLGTKSPAIDPLFKCSQITNKAEGLCSPFYGSNTAYSNWTDDEGMPAVYAKSSDTEGGDPDEFTNGNGTQEDAILICNYVHLVRDI